ncbi:hypothetical protein HWQ46_00370 [Shewanella sp. D64]|uniref:hypothetical protein n=1 Tax=unclassified Shewanella TaxID=196818 RepID=UPI0022BA62EE|nr:MULTISPECIES: hypothetical protein [unclassified Shewanella]MEC4724006.1 hypothetical protein [Shewanella sp. D64]MEC4736026.1 hypothetical protein [Shewanella sp. E94]WBJ98028.1 hypothetical protein HWQ47_13485 [Shewanella sp. MTB7]WBJ98039.1 hypothetical protein HWQ47_13540 [Shewanella sp. MTB7]
MEFISELFAVMIGLASDLLSFFQSVFSLIFDIFDYAYEWAIKLWINGEIQMVEMAYRITAELFSQYEVYTLLSNVFNKLPPDISYSAHALGIVAGVRIVIDAMGVAFVLRVMGW